VAKDLIARGVTRPQQFACQGGSNGGLLVGKGREMPRASWRARRRQPEPVRSYRGESLSAIVLKILKLVISGINSSQCSLVDSHKQNAKIFPVQPFLVS
jgi:hypothetical protein